MNTTITEKLNGHGYQDSLNSVYHIHWTSTYIKLIFLLHNSIQNAFLRNEKEIYEEVLPVHVATFDYFGKYHINPIKHHGVLHFAKGHYLEPKV